MDIKNVFLFIYYLSTLFKHINWLKITCYIILINIPLIQSVFILILLFITIFLLILCLRILYNK